MTITRKTIQVIARTFAKDEEGATAIEYGLFAALVGAVIVGTVTTLGQETNKTFSTVSSAMQTANENAASDTSGSSE